MNTELKQGGNEQRTGPSDALCNAIVASMLTAGTVFGLLGSNFGLRYGWLASFGGMIAGIIIGLVAPFVIIRTLFRLGSMFRRRS